MTARTKAAPATPRRRTPPAAAMDAAGAPEAAARRQRIAALAYARFLARGGAHGHALEDWLEAERQLEAEERRP